MIERQIVAQNIKEYLIQEYVAANVSKGGHSHTKMQRTPLGEKIIIYASRPGLIVGRKGANIKKLTKELKKKFSLENPQIEISEVENIYADPQIVAEMIASSLERFGTERFKGVGHKMLAEIMNAGALGVEIVMSGKIPSARARNWRFYSGYLKKCGDTALTGVKTAYSNAMLKTGVIGIKVKIMPPEAKELSEIKIKEEETVEEVEKEAKKEEKKEKPKKKKKVKKSEEKKDADKK